MHATCNGALGKKLLLYLFFLYSKTYHSKCRVDILVSILADSKAVTDYNILFLDSVDTKMIPCWLSVCKLWK